MSTLPITIPCLEHGDSAKEDPQKLILASRLGAYLQEEGFYMDSLHWRKLVFDITSVLAWIPP